MWSLLERLRKVIIVAVLSIVPLVLLYVQSKDEEIRHFVSWPIIEISGVLEKGALAVTGGVSDILFRYFYAVSRADELKSLRVEVQEAKALKAKIAELEAERASITELYFNHTESGLPKGELARVIARAGVPLSRMIRLDRGFAHGIKPNSPVIAHGGAVGQVLSVAPHFSDVLLITDASSALDAKIVGSDARGLLRGITSSTEYLMEIRDIDGMVRVEPGNVVVTSGVNSNFPHGIPIGTVIESSRSRDGLYISARIEPLVMMDRLAHVLVLPIIDTQNDVDRYKAAWPMAVQ